MVVSDLKQIKGRSFAADVSKEDQVAALVDFAVRELGGLDAMVNNAGIGEQDAPLDEKSAEDWNRVIGVNLTGAFYGLKHAARVMKKAGRGGVIVNMASVLGLVGFAGAPAYSAAKHGLLGLTKAAALNLAAAKIRTGDPFRRDLRWLIARGGIDGASSLRAHDSASC